MKKRNPSNIKTVSKLCIGFLLALAMLCTNHGSFRTSKRRSVKRVIFLSAASDVRLQLQNPIAYPAFADWDVRVWVPVELAPDNSHYDSVAAVFLMNDLSAPVALKLPGPVVALNMPEPEPLPVLLYILFLAAFGLVGFFSAAPATTMPLQQHRPAFGCGSLKLWILKKAHWEATNAG